MSEGVPPITQATSSTADLMKNWSIAIITFIFVLLYALSTIGKYESAEAVKNLQPIVFVIIGYYFGRLPSQPVESSLKSQVTNQSNIAAAARNAEKKAEIVRESLEEKIKNARIVLETGNGTEIVERSENSNSIKSAIKILGS